MKLALILLSALVVISHQQYLRPAGMRWLSQQNTARDIFHYQPVHYDDMDVDIPYFRFAKPTKAIAYFDREEASSPVLDASFDEPIADVNDLYDVQSRYKGAGRYPPQSPNARWLFNYGGTGGNGNTVVHPFWKTATFTVTSTVTVAVIQSCIPAASFSASGPCRKKRDIMASLVDADDNQFPIEPTAKTEQVIATALAAGGELTREKRHLQTEGITELSSSKATDADEITRDKRFFYFNNHFVVSSTVTSYFFITSTVLKTVFNLGSSLQCLPAGYGIC